MKTNDAKEGDLKVWWIPQLGMSGEPFEYLVPSIEAAAVLIDALSMYDLYQYHNMIKPDYSNTGGLNVLHDGEWVDWEHPETFDDIREHIAAREQAA
jgi:hypothetical protein